MMGMAVRNEKKDTEQIKIETLESIIHEKINIINCLQSKLNQNRTLDDNMETMRETP